MSTSSLVRVTYYLRMQPGMQTDIVFELDREFTVGQSWGAVVNQSDAQLHTSTQQAIVRHAYEAAAQLDNAVVYQIDVIEHGSAQPVNADGQRRTNGDYVIALYSAGEETHRLDEFTGMWYGIEYADFASEDEAVNSALTRALDGAENDIEAVLELKINAGHRSGQFILPESRVGVFYWEVITRERLLVETGELPELTDGN